MIRMEDAQKSLELLLSLTIASPRHRTSGLYLTLYRAYDANLGRWVSRDPFKKSMFANLYGYVGNKPINSIDYLGLQSSEINNLVNLSNYVDVDPNNILDRLGSQMNSCPVNPAPSCTPDHPCLENPSPEQDECRMVPIFPLLGLEKLVCKKPSEWGDSEEPGEQPHTHEEWEEPVEVPRQPEIETTID